MRHKITSRLLLLLMLAGGCGLLVACGQKGPLYLPEDTGQPEN